MHAHAPSLTHNTRPSPQTPQPLTQAFVAIDNKEAGDKEIFGKFLNDPVHKALAACSEMRPSVDIFVGGEGDGTGVGAGAARTEFRSTAAKEVAAA